MWRGLFEPSLSLFLVWMIKYPQFSLSPRLLLPTRLSLFCLHLSISFSSCICSTFGWRRCFVSFISSFCFFITLRMGFMCYHGAVKIRAPPPEGLLSVSKVRRGKHTVVSHWIFHLNLWNIHRWGQRTWTTWAHCNNVPLFVQILHSIALVPIKSGWEGCMCVCILYIHVCQICRCINRFAYSAFGWHGWLTGRCPWRALVSCLKCHCQCTVVWAFVEGAFGSVWVCLFIYLHGRSGELRE